MSSEREALRAERVFSFERLSGLFKALALSTRGLMARGTAQRYLGDTIFRGMGTVTSSAWYWSDHGPAHSRSQDPTSSSKPNSVEVTDVIRDATNCARAQLTISAHGGQSQSASGVFWDSFRLDLLLPLQLGVGTKGGGEHFVRAVQRALDNYKCQKFNHLTSLNFRTLSTPSIKERSPQCRLAPLPSR